MELDEAAQRELKRVMLETQYGLRVEHIEAGHAALGYRYSSKRVALSEEGTLLLGSFARNSHAPAAMAGCLVDHPLIERAFGIVEQACRALSIAAYDERSARGDLRAVWAKTNGREVSVTLVVSDGQGRAANELPIVLHGLHSVWVSVHSATSNNLRGEAAKLAAGQARLTVDLLGCEVDVGALGFLQPNPEVAALAYGALLEERGAAAAPTLAFDLYAGAGVTTQVLRARYVEVVACEAHPESAARLGVAPQTTKQCLAGELARPVRRPIPLVIANPPRKGLGPEVVAQLRALGPAELRIMSCGPEGLARDLAGLTSSGRFVLRELRAFDTLPQTPHIELVARLALGTSAAAEGGSSAGP